MKTSFIQVGILLFVLAVTVVVVCSISSSKNDSRRPLAAAKPAEAVKDFGPVSSAPVQTPATATVQAAPVISTVAPVAAPASVATPLIVLPANATSVPDDALLRLSRFVNLIQATNQAPEKERWAQAVPIAAKLMEGPCDCDQRNWLKHFVRMGNDALSGSIAQYVEEAQVMSTLRRYDTQPTSVR